MPATHYIKNIIHISCVVCTDSQKLWLLFQEIARDKSKLKPKNLNENNIIYLPLRFEEKNWQELSILILKRSLFIFLSTNFYFRVFVW